LWYGLFPLPFAPVPEKLTDVELATPGFSVVRNFKPYGRFSDHKLPPAIGQSHFPGPRWSTQLWVAIPFPNTKRLVAFHYCGFPIRGRLFEIPIGVPATLFNSPVGIKFLSTGVEFAWHGSVIT